MTARGESTPKARRTQVLPTARWVLIAERGTERGGEGRAARVSKFTLVEAHFELRT